MSANSTVDKLTQTIIKTIAERKPQNVQQLIFFVKQRVPISEEKLLDVILKLESQGRINLESPILTVPLKLSTYVRTRQALWYWATIAIAIITVAIVFTVPENTYPWSYLRTAIGAIFVLWLPGYTFIKALFPVHSPIKTSSENLDSVKRIALSIGMSLTIVPIVGLILNYTPFGIRLTPILLSLLALTTIFATVAVTREHQTKRQLINKDSSSMKIKGN